MRSKKEPLKCDRTRRVGGSAAGKILCRVLYVISHALLPLKRCGEFMCEALPPTLWRFVASVASMLRCYGGVEFVISSK